MKRVVCAVFDRAVQTFGQPFFVAAVGAAVRSFTDEVNRKADDNALHAHPEDFELWHLGWFDDEHGAFIPCDGAEATRMLTRAQDVKV